MGSDMYMEAQNFRPRPTKVSWEGFGEDARLVVEQDYPISGYSVVYRDVFDENDKTQVNLLALAGVPESKIPPRPQKRVATSERIRRVLSEEYDWHNEQALRRVMEIVRGVDSDGLVE